MPKQKVAIIGIDSMVPAFVEKFVSEGVLPSIGQIIKKGVFSESWSQIPTLTPTNWATIATGATTGTHGITDFGVPVPPSNPDQAKFARKVFTAFHAEVKGVSGFDSRAYTAEQLWMTAERHGLRSIVLNYPGCWPPRIKRGIVALHGAPLGSPFIITDGLAYTNVTNVHTKFAGGVWGFLELTSKLDLHNAKGWQHIPPSDLPPLEAEIEVTKDHRLQMLILASKSKYDHIILAKEKDAKNPLFTLNQGEWSNFVVGKFKVDREEKKGSYRFNLLELSPDAQRVILWRSQVHPVTDFAYPAKVARDLIKHCGPFIDNPLPFLPAQGYYDAYLDEVQYHCRWLAKAARYLTSTHDWDLLMMKLHCIDDIQHELWRGLDHTWSYHDPSISKESWRVLEKTYGLMDDVVGEIMKIVGRDGVTIALSDHGHFAYNRTILVTNAFVDAGLIVLRSDGGIDWSKSKAFGGKCHVYVNLKGRKLLFDGTGTVNAGEEYERVRDQIIDCLLGMKDPVTGVHPIPVALRREESGPIGMNGPNCGDVVFACAAGYDAVENYVGGQDGVVVPPLPNSWGHIESIHGRNWPDVSLPVGTMKGTFVMKGPGVKAGHRRRRPINMIDVAPTAAYLLGIPPPANADGSIITDLLDDVAGR